jgi:hypothetical protein
MEGEPAPTNEINAGENEYAGACANLSVIVAGLTTISLMVTLTVMVSVPRTNCCSPRNAAGEKGNREYL